MESHHRADKLWISLLILAPVLGKYLPGQVFLGPLGLDVERFAFLFVTLPALAKLRRSPQLVFTGLDLSIIGLILWLMLSVTWALDPATSAAAANNLVWYLLWYGVLIVLLDCRRILRSLTPVLVIFAAFLVGYVLLAFATGEFEKAYLFGLVSRNQVARDAVALIPIVAVATSLGSYWRRLATTIVLMGLIILIPILNSRGGLVGLLVIISLTAILYIHRLTEYSLRTGVGFGIIFGGSLAASLVGAIRAGWIGQRLADIPLTPSALASPTVLGQDRYRVYTTGLQTIADNWLFGIGFGSFRTVMATQWGKGLRAHDLFSRVALSAGIGALILTIVIGVLTLRNYITIAANRPDQSLVPAYGLSFVGMVGVGMTNIVIYEPMFYLLLGIGAHHLLIGK